MSRKILYSIIALAGFLLAAHTASAQVIVIQPANPMKQAEDQAKAILTDWFKTYLNRKPNGQEMASMMTKLRMGANSSSILLTILSSQEYYKKTGGKNSSFVTALYVDVYGRKPELAVVNTLTADLNSMTRTDYIISFLKNSKIPTNPFGLLVMP